MTTAPKNNANPMWGGHYASAPDTMMAKINASIDVDKALYHHDITGSLAHVTMLAASGILTHEEAATITRGLHQIHEEIAREEMVWDEALEDIHMHIEARLKEIVGEVAGKLHTARSRNDQVATDLRLYLRDACDMLMVDILTLQRTLVAQAERHADTIMPGFTHLQTAQPVTFGHHLLAYVEMLQRDKTRFLDARARLNECPLGAAALAGTSFPIDRHLTAEKLGFDRPCANSLDAVSSRDAAVEMVAACAIALAHLSRLAEELVIWSSALVKFVTLPESFTSGSSIMPQKRNPDAAELIRAKTGRVNGDLVQLLTILKGTPLAYNKDLQEDKEPVFDAVDSLSLCLCAMNGMMEGIQPHTENMLRAASAGFSTATDLADWLVRTLNIPFRNAHHITGKIVNLAEAARCALWQVPLAEMQAVEPRITQEVYAVLKVEHSVASRRSYGGTAPERVREQIARVRKEYGV
jgi:argininosuccinate lyase